MFDQSSHRYHRDDSDTEVSDVEEPPFSARDFFPRGRVDTKDLLMQVRDAERRWHRLHPTRLRTACGLVVTQWHADNIRHGLSIEHPLAECECWTTAERTEADDKRRRGNGQDDAP